MERTVVHTDGGHRYTMAGSAWFVDTSNLGVMSLPCLRSDVAELHAMVSGVENTTGPLLLKTDHTGFLGATRNAVLNRMRRYVSRQPYSLAEDLMERFEVASEGREVEFVYAPSKREEALVELRVCDMLERYTRRAAYVLDREVRITGADLVVDEGADLLKEYARILEDWEVPYSQARDLVRAKDA